MKNFNVNATSLTIRITCEDRGEMVEHKVLDIPSPNYLADNASDSENSSEEIVEHEHHSYKIVLYVNMNEGNVEVYNDDTDEEIEDFEVVEDISEIEDLCAEEQETNQQNKKASAC